MAEIRGKADVDLEAIAGALAEYEITRPEASVLLYRQNSATIRVRIVDPQFTGVSKADRHDAVWEFLTRLPDDVLSQVSTLLLLTPDERPLSFADFEFDNPVRSKL